MDSSPHTWLAQIAESKVVCALAEQLQQTSRVIAQGSRGSSPTLVAGALAVRMRRPVLLVVAHLDEADDAIDDLELFDAAGMSLATERFGALEVLPGESSVSLELLAERLAVVGRLAEGRCPDVIVAPIQALMQPVPPPERLASLSLKLREGEHLPPGELIEWLSDAGYQRQDAIEQPGDFAVRGGILDLYPPIGSTTDDAADRDALGPIRLDYFGDVIESIRRIDPDSMGSTGRVGAARIIGASAERLQADDQSTDLVGMLPQDSIVVLHEVLELSEQARGYYERLTNARSIHAPRIIFQKLTRRPHVQINQYSTKKGDAFVELPVGQLVRFDTAAEGAVKEVAVLAGLAGEFSGGVSSHSGASGGGLNHQVVVLCQKPAERDRLIELVREHAPESESAIRFEVAYLHRGFTWGAGGGGAASDTGTPCLTLVPHHELFHRYDTRRRIRRLSADAAGSVREAFFDVEVGSYVVHVDHGISRFTGLKLMRRGGLTQEFLTLEFAGSALLHVPATQIDLVQKYVGGFHGAPPLSNLGGKKWARQKESVAEAVKDLAAELLRVQAARQTQPGIRYPPDTAWQKEFEAEFPYEETEDQLAAVLATKNDMSEDRPMDRLICGDVGFGKTEVAIRAAFKAIEFGRQVAVLVPTTVLAEQHGRTFRERMADYPFRIESISRFRTSAEQRKLIEELAAGRIDIIIGTHRLLSKDVRFADLGLVVIDEEQRFGVEHKNKLLEFRLTADVLTLTATPIPRTLHMSMVGLRDISSLSTPPADRRAIVTEVIPYEKQRVKHALIRELNRDGQVYFVHNRVYNIQTVADEVHKLVPDARIMIGHGQMPSRALERVMLAFMRHDVDVLVCTTIIESGIDIPTANTMFINEADHFGLADLHQLRGRVGRYKHRAYCYLLLPEDRTVNEQAIKRMQAIEQYSMLGAGFKIAMRDLEIRGAGNLLGAEQSGHIAAVGYEMYCTLLEHQAKKLRNEPIIEPAKTHLELPVTGSFPKRYISSDKFRMEAYRRLSRSATLEELKSVVQNLRDAYGDPPPAAQSLIDLAEIRLAAAAVGIDSIKLDSPDLIFRTKTLTRLEQVFKGAPGRISVVDERTVYYRPPSNYLDPPATLLAVLRKLLLRQLRDTAPARSA